MKRQLGLAFFLFSLVVFVTGCSSTPEAASVPESPAETVVDEAALAAEEAAKAAAEAAALAEETARLMAELTAARGAAEAAGADSAYPDEFAKVSSDYDALIQAQKDEPTKDYRSQIENLRDTYLAMAKLAEAQDLRKRIEEANLLDYDAEALQKGDAAMAQTKTLYGQGASGAQLLEQATIAYDSYYSIMSANYATLCESQREQALAAKKKADSIKAAMAAKVEYDAADKVLSGAEAAYVIQDFAPAYDGFVEATNSFNAIYDDVFVKRATAEEAIRRAKQKVAASAEIAAEADEIAPLQPEEGSTSESGDTEIESELKALSEETSEIQTDTTSETQSTEITDINPISEQETSFNEVVSDGDAVSTDLSSTDSASATESSETGVSSLETSSQDVPSSDESSIDSVTTNASQEVIK